MTRGAGETPREIKGVAVAVEDVGVGGPHADTGVGGAFEPVTTARHPRD